ncbi:MAG: hypothetical protein L0Z50_09040 [Verrucomicrobiales bacterium]|nr:hypothetical protein [Verrucomicrobiales bacterium]
MKANTSSDTSFHKSPGVGRGILRANALWLTIGATGGLLMDVLGIFFGHGPQSRIVTVAPHTGIAFIEAHGLALIVSILLWQVAPLRSWHFAAAAVDVLLGSANLVFWQFFVAGDMLALGYITTSLHWLFAVLQLFAASSAPSSAFNHRSSEANA